MTKVNLFLLLLLAIMLVWARSDGVKNFTLATLLPSPTATMTPTPTPIPISNPVRFVIPKLQVDAPVIPVGSDAQGKMALPQEWDKVGWYQFGYKPGEAGNAVIAGHLDSTTGAGAIFYYLWKLQPGDPMYIIDSYGRSHTFTVTQQVTYPYSQVPIDTIFGSSNRKLLNLITCTGIWNPLIHNYSERRVVTAELTQ